MVDIGISGFKVNQQQRQRPMMNSQKDPRRTSEGANKVTQQQLGGASEGAFEQEQNVFYNAQLPPHPIAVKKRQTIETKRFTSAQSGNNEANPALLQKKKILPPISGDRTREIQSAYGRKKSFATSASPKSHLLQAAPQQREDNNKENQLTKTLQLQRQISVKTYLQRYKPESSADEDTYAKIGMFFLYKPASLLHNLQKKQYYLKFSDKQGLPKSRIGESQQFENTLIQKLQKIVSTKSKYRYREKCDFGRSLILNTLKINLREVSLRAWADQQAQAGDEYDDLEDSHDEDNNSKNGKPQGGVAKSMPLFSLDTMNHWRKKKGVAPNQKIFIVAGGYVELRNKLLELGWVENPDPESFCYDMKWTSRTADINFDTLLDFQSPNHFKGNGSLSSKQGLAKNLKNLVWYENRNQHEFFPRCFDLNDQQEFEDFIEEFKLGKAESLLKQFVSAGKLPQSLAETLRVKVCIAIINRKTADIRDKIGAILYQDSYPIVSPQEWDFLNSPESQSKEQQTLLLQSVEGELDSERTKQQNILNYARDTIALLERCCCQQFFMNGDKNLWIAKPAGLSRGRGIRTFDDLAALMQYVCGRDDLQWVAQKYLEFGLLIEKRRFDIRQWVIVSDFSPLTIWFYDECYVRMCTVEYDEKDINNKFNFMVNNAIQKKAENFEEEKESTMMFGQQFKEYLIMNKGEDFYTQYIKKGMINAIINTLKSVQETIGQRKNSFEMFGYDFMVDKAFNVWLIEINASPSMEFSTKVTERMVKQGLQDTGKLIHNYICNGKKYQKDGDYGLWKLIYRESVPSK